MPLAFAEKPTFHCYLMPGTPIQTYDYTSMCNEPKGTVPVINSKGKEVDGEHDVLCFYDAFCEPIGKDFADQPIEKLSLTQIQDKLQDSIVFRSNLICSGKAMFDDGASTGVNCPDPTKCKDLEVLFNAPMPRAFVPGAKTAIPIKVQGDR